METDRRPNDREWIRELEAKVAEQRNYIDLLVKAGKGSEDYAERLRSGVLAEIARTDDLSLGYRLEEFLVTLPSSRLEVTPDAP
jgi:hypothetical protein